MGNFGSSWHSVSHMLECAPPGSVLGLMTSENDP